MKPDIICFSHLRWNFVYQRPQHILSRMAINSRVFYVEEPVFRAGATPSYEMHRDAESQVYIVTPLLDASLSDVAAIEAQAAIVDSLLQTQNIATYLVWYYSPMAFAFSSHLKPVALVYDCMDELSAFLFAPAALKQNELALFEKADIVFTGGNTLYKAKKHLHGNIHAFPSSIDKNHFRAARNGLNEPDDQAVIAGPKIGFFGVIDERLDIPFLTQLADLRPGWNFILVGPVVKIDPAILPVKSNIFYLGPKNYSELPAYLSWWDIAMMPFARNASTRFISPTKTPEYLAGGKPVIAPSIADVVDPYGILGLVRIADTPEQFIAAAEEILGEGPSGEGPSGEWLDKVDAFLEDLSWDNTVSRMATLIDQCIPQPSSSSPQNIISYV